MKAKRHRLSKRLLFALLFAVSLAAAYLHFGIFPGKLKEPALRQIAAYAPFRIDFDKALYLPFRGLRLDSLKVWDKAGRPLFYARSLLVDFKLIPFFREKKIIVSRFTLDAPVYELLMDAPQAPILPPPRTRLSGQIAVPVVPARRKLGIADVQQGPYALLPENIYLEGIDITNGVVVVRKTRGTPPVEIVRGLNMRLGFEKRPLLQFRGSFELGSKPYADILLKGSWDLQMSQYDLLFEAKSRHVPVWFRDFQRGHFIALESGRVHLRARLKKVRDGVAAFRALVELSDARLRANNADYAGKMALDAQGFFNFTHRTFEGTRGSLVLTDVDAANVSRSIPRVDNLTGRVLFEPGLLTIESLRGDYKKVAFHANGTVRSFKELYLSGRIHSDSGLDRVLSLVPDHHQKALKDFRVEGACLAVTSVKGSLRKPEALRMEHKLLVSKTSVKNPAKKVDISRLSAEIFLDNTGYRVRNCRFLNAGKPHSLDAFVPTSPQTAGDLDFQTEDLLLTASYFLDKYHARIEKGTAITRGIVASFTGRVSHFTDPYLDIQGDMETDLALASGYFTEKAPALKNAGLRGTLKSPFLLKGRWSDPAGWDLQADLKAFPLFLKDNLRLDNFEMQVRMKNRVVSVPHLSALTYQGALNAHGFFDLSKPGTFFDIHVRANSLRVEHLLKDLDPRQDKLAGAATFQFSMNGYLNAQRTFRGTGAADIRDGFLFRSGMFKQMGEPVAFVRVEGMEDVVFHSASGTFAIRDKKVWTDDLAVMGSTVDLSLKGSVGFDQNVDMVMDIRYSEDVVRGAEETGGIMPFMIQTAENHISQYKVSGSLKKPEYEKMALSPAR